MPKLITLLGFLVFYLILSPTLLVKPVLAQTYSIKEAQINITVNQDGSAHVEEIRIYDFRGDFTFAYLTKQLEPDQSLEPGRTQVYQIQDVEVCDERSCFTQIKNPQEFAAADNNRPNRHFYVKHGQREVEIRWFYRAYSTERTFKVSYFVPNMVTKHQDIAEIYWQLVGKDWDVRHNHVAAVIDLPPTNQW